MTRASNLVVGLALLAACQQGDPAAPSDAPVGPSAAVTHNRFRDFVIHDFVVANPCTGEIVLLHLDQMFVLHEVSREGKFFHGHFTFMDRGTNGQGLTSGAIYRQTGSEQETFHVKGEVNTVHTIEVTVNLIGKGKVPNFLIHEIFHVTLTSTGELRSGFDRLRQVCQG